GGMGGLAQVLAKLFQELGGTLRLGTEVEDIIVVDGAARGVLLTDEREIPADRVVMNVDLPTVYRKFMRDIPRSWNTRRQERMTLGCSAAVFLWGVDQAYPHLRHHNVFLPMAYPEALRQIFEEDRIPDEPAFYLCAPARTDASAAPPGKESLM